MDRQLTTARHGSGLRPRFAQMRLSSAGFAILCTVVIAATALGGLARAAEWPTRPIKVIAPSTPGGAADTFARLLAEYLPPLLHQPVIVDNRAGAGGLIGVAAAAHAEPDGYTLVTSSVAYLAIAPAVSPNAGVDPMRDFTHIAYLGGPPNAFVVHPSLGIHSLKELTTLARQQGPIDFVSPGVGSLGHLLVEAFAHEAGIKVQHIPHKGSSQAMLDLITGTVKFGTMTWSSAIGQIRANAVIPIAVSSMTRIADFSSVPTLRDEGYDLVALTWYALSGPAGLSNEIVGKLNRAVNEAWAMPQLRQRLADDVILAEPMTPGQITAYMASEVSKWGPVARRVVASQ